MDVTSKTVEIKLDSVVLQGNLDRPNPRNGKVGGLVVFAHGSGSSRFSPRNRYVAKALQEKGFGTLLFDLLTEQEDQKYETRFDIELLSERLEKTTSWVLGMSQLKSAHVGYFGASTGAAAALVASAELGSNLIKAVVSRGGRADMAGSYLSRVIVPTLLIVGSRDEEVMALNQSALKELNSEAKQLVIVPGASHLFEEEGALKQVAEHAAEWFLKYL